MTRRLVRPALFSVVALLTVVPCGSARLAKCNQLYPLHGGTKSVRASCGPRVKGIQWLLGGHKPSVYTKTKPTFHWAPNGLYGARTKTAVRAMKYRLGYPAKGQCGARVSALTTTTSQHLVRLLTGRVHRPTCWVGLAAERIKGTVVPGATKTAITIKLLEFSQIGVTESPWGSNRGARISYASGGYGPYQGSTGAYGLAWCASFGDWALKVVTGHGFGSANDAYVPAIAAHAQANGWLQAKPRLGSYVIFLQPDGRLASAYHIGYVIRLVGSSGVMTVEGNSSNAVHEVYRRFDVYRMVYVNVPGVA